MSGENIKQRLCCVDGCQRNDIAGRGLCNKHYLRAVRSGKIHEYDLQPRQYIYKYCSVDGCGNKYRSRGFCQAHYLRWRNFGDPLFIKIAPRLSFKRPHELKQFFLDNIEKQSSGCWEWIGTRRAEKGKEYGIIYISGRPYVASRISAYIFKGFDINSPLLVCHHCDFPPCVRPLCLFIGSYKDNVLDAVKKGRWNPPKGCRQHNSKLNDHKVRRIYLLLRIGKLSQGKIGNFFGVGSETIRSIALKKTWKHVL